MAQSTKSRTYFHLAYMLSLASKITKNSYLLPSRVRQREAARQGPAFGVIPVFIPLHPSPSIRFVFYHCKAIDLLSYKLILEGIFSFSSSMVYLEAIVSADGLLSQLKLIEQLYFLVCTMCRKRGLRIAYVQSLARFSAVEQLFVLERPCGLAKLLFAMSILRATLFISFRKAATSWPEYVDISELTDPLISRAEGYALSL